MKIISLMKELKSAAHELDDSKVAWIDKWMVIDLNRKALILFDDLKRLSLSEEVKEHEIKALIEATETFLTEVQPVIQLINK